MTIEQIVHEELNSGWNRIIGALLKRVRKRLNEPALTGEQLQEIEKAFKSWVKE